MRLPSPPRWNSWTLKGFQIRRKSENWKISERKRKKEKKLNRQKKQRDNVVTQVNLKNISQALEMYYVEFGRYPNKEEGLDILFREIDAIGRTQTAPDEKLRRTGLAYLRFSIEQKDYFDIINYFLATPSVILGSELKQQIDRKGSLILELIAGFIHTGISDGIFRSVDPKKYAVMFWGALHGLTQFKKLEKTVLEGEDHGRIFNYAVEQLIDGLKNSEQP